MVVVCRQYPEMSHPAMVLAQEPSLLEYQHLQELAASI